MHKAGFVNIIGCPNVGKSTLLNALVGEKLAIVTSKAQTTRHRIMGIVSTENYQIVFSDTPGILKPNYKLQEKMMQFVQSAMSDADVFLVITDVFEDIEFDPDFLSKLQKINTPIIVCVNKCDAVNEERSIQKIDAWKDKLPKANILPISALKKINLEILLNKIVSLLPEGEAFYDKSELTDKPERFFVSEIIREKILIQFKKEIPYSCEVIVTSFKEESKIIRIQAEILVERETQKGILIGDKGAAIKKLGIAARKEAEIFFGKQIHLELFVKVEKNWRESDRFLKNRGY